MILTKKFCFWSWCCNVTCITCMLLHYEVVPKIKCQLTCACNFKTMMGFYKLLILIHTLSFCPFFFFLVWWALMDFSDSHAGINFLVGDTHPDKTIMLMSFSFFFFLTLKFCCFLRSKIWMQRACIHSSTHTLTQICCIINQSVAHLLACSVCFFPSIKHLLLLVWNVTLHVACCLWTDLEGPTLTSPSLFFLYLPDWNLLPHTIIQLHPVAGNKNKQAEGKKKARTYLPPRTMDRKW